MTKRVILIAFMLLGMISRLNAGVIPSNIQWPLKSKDVRHISIFFDTDDAVEIVGRTCSNRRFPKHLGIDIMASENTKVYPTYEGIVKRIGFTNKWGNYLVIEHTNGSSKWTSTYWHLNNVVVFEGNRVYKNTELSEIYNTSHVGDVSHLHFGIRPYSYSSISKKGIGGCSNLYGFVDPLKYLPNKGYKLIDDSDVLHIGNWKDSVSTDFYTGKGYKATNNYKDAVKYTYNVPSSGYYSVYSRFTTSSNRTKRAKYLLIVDGNVKKYKTLDQTNVNYRAKSNYLFYYYFTKNSKVEIVIYNGNKVDWLISDAILFRKR